MNERHIEEILGNINLIIITNRHDPIYKRHKKSTKEEPKKQQNRIFVHENMVKIVIIDRRTDESCNFKINLWLNLDDVIYNKEKAILEKKEVF